MSNNNSCTHIKVTGVRCNSPALRGEQFCYFHQNAHRGVRRPKQSRLHPIALIEDEESIQYALMEVINALMRNTIDVKRATLIIRALHIAVKNAARVKYNVHSRDMVTEIPEYAAPPIDADDAETSEADLPYSAFLPPQSEHAIAEQRRLANKAQEWRDQQAAIRATLERTAQTVARSHHHVGADAPVRPGREATVPPAAATPTPNVATAPAPVPPHDFKKSQPTPAAEPNAPVAPPRTAATTSAATKKKPASAPAAAPQEQKIAAHGASRR
jgi:hypothetical protein